MRSPLFVPAFFLSASVAFASEWEPAPERKAELFNLVIQDCGSCHGLTMKGGLGSPLLPQNLEGKDTDVLTAIVLDGLPGTPMPPWRSQFQDGEARWIIEQLKKGLEQ